MDIKDIEFKVTTSTPNKYKPKFTQEKTILVIDWSAITENRKHSLFSAELPITRPDEISEIRYRVARKLYPIIEELKPFMVVFAIVNKGPNGQRQYWRCDYLEEYYIDNTKVMYSDTTGNFYYKMDNKVFIVEGEELTRVTKKNTPRDLEETHGAPDKDLVPKYKGNRANLPWDFQMSKELYRTEMKKLLLELAGTVENSRIVDVHGAEADDIAGVLANTSNQVNHVLYTHDGDWTQLQSETTHILNLSTDTYLSPIDTTEFIETKIIQGDSGDGISSTWIIGKATDIRGKDCNLGAKGASTIWANKETHLIEDNVYGRNRMLIELSLDTIPKDIIEGTIKAIKEKVDYPKYTWDHFTLSPKEQELLLEERTSSILTRKKTPVLLQELEGDC